jgi:heat shock protein HtpX
MQPTFRDLIAANKQKSFWLVLFFILFVAVTAVVLSLGIIAYAAPEMLDELQILPSLAIGAVSAVVAFLISLWAYYGGSSMVLAVSGAKPLVHQDDPELVNVVEEMAIAAGVPMPKVYLIDDSAPNAFATGRDPQHAAVAITTGLRTKLTRDELQGVMAHEMAHIRNFDIRLMLLMAVLVGAIAMLADFFWRIVWVSGSSSRRHGRSSDKNKGAGGLAIIFIVLAMILALIAPFLAQLIQLAVSREREYLADASAVEFTRYPQGLASALKKIDADPEVLEAANQGTAHLYIANPIKKFEARAKSAFSSHPPIEERVRRLEALVA